MTKLTSNDCVNLLGLLNRVNIAGNEARAVHELQQKITAIGNESLDPVQNVKPVTETTRKHQDSGGG